MMTKQVKDPFVTVGLGTGEDFHSRDPGSCSGGVHAATELLFLQAVRTLQVPRMIQTM